MATHPFQGVLTPMLTPLTAAFEIDVPAVGRMVDHLLGGGADGVFIMGSAGEGPLLSPGAAATLAGAARDAVGSRAPLLVGISAPSTPQALVNLAAVAPAKPDAVVATLPFYLPPGDPEETIAHFRALAAASPCPVIAYDIPQYIGWGPAAETVLRLREIPNVAGVKLSATDWHKLETVLLGAADTPEFAVLLGHSQLFAPGLLLGAAGLVPVTGNAHPSLPAACWAARAAGVPTLGAAVLRLRHAAERYQAIAPLIPALKAACHARGLCEPWVMPPYTTADAATRDRVRQLMTAIDGEA